MARGASFHRDLAPLYHRQCPTNPTLEVSSLVTMYNSVEGLFCAAKCDALRRYEKRRDRCTTYLLEEGQETEGAIEAA
jgi:hypothetical protein